MMTLQLIPARGRKRADVIHQFKGRKLQLIPVRGRKPTTLLVDDDMLAAITTYPRKGTETPCRACRW